MTPSIKSQALEILAAAEKGWAANENPCSPDTVAHLMRTLLRYEEALEWYGFKMVPDCMNENKLEVTTGLGRRARKALEGKTE